MTYGFKSRLAHHTWTSAWRTCWRPPFLLNDPYILGVILFACTTYDSVRLPTDRLFCTRMTSALFLRYSTLKIKWCNRDGNSHHYFCRPLLPYLILHSSRFLIEKAADAPCRSTDCQRHIMCLELICSSFSGFELKLKFSTRMHRYLFYCLAPERIGIFRPLFSKLTKYNLNGGFYLIFT